MQTPSRVPSDMVAVGSAGPGVAARPAVSERMECSLPPWSVRVGRGRDYALWEDALRDLLPKLSLRWESIFEQPPAAPSGDALTVDNHSLWKGAIEQYQSEGTALFEAVRPSLVLTEPYALQDIKTIAAYKRDGVKDGRALLRWALGFVDQSGLACQMQLVADIHAKKLSVSATKFELAQHLSSLWEMWGALTNSDPAEPASFFRYLLVSMPTEPECPIVHVRRYLVDLLDRGDSPLLRDLDGESGLFAKMVAYGASLGLKDTQASLSVLRGAQGGAPEGGGKTQETSSGKKKDKRKTQACCNSFVCPGKDNTPDGFCICRAASNFNVDSIEKEGEREYVKLLRKYDAANPGKSLKVSVKVVRESVGGGSMNFMAPLPKALRGELSDEAALDLWLAEHNGETQGLFVMGDISGAGDLKLTIVEEEDAQGGPPAEASSSFGTATSVGSATGAEEELARVKAELEVAQLRVKELETPAPASRTPSDVSTRPPPQTPTPEVQHKPNPALDRPTSFSFNATPKELYARCLANTPALSRGGSASKARQPVFDSTPEEKDTADAAGGANKKDKETSAEMIARGLATAEKEKRELKDKVSKSKKLTLGGMLRAAARLLLATGGNLKTLGALVADYCGDLTVHQLATLALALYAFGGPMKRGAKWTLGKMVKWLVQMSLGGIAASLNDARALVASTATAIIAKVLKTLLSKVTTSSSPQGALPLQSPPAQHMQPQMEPRAAQEQSPLPRQAYAPGEQGGQTRAVSLDLDARTVNGPPCQLCGWRSIAPWRFPEKCNLCGLELCVTCLRKHECVEFEHGNALQLPTLLCIGCKDDSCPSSTGTINASPSLQAFAPPASGPHVACGPASVNVSTAECTAAGSDALLAIGDNHLSDSVLMAAEELGSTDGYTPALMDNGASNGTSCSRSLEGAILSTKRLEDAGSIGLGSDGATLASLGSYLFVLKRYGKEGSDTVVRRMKHTPNLPMAMVFSEANENKAHGYGIYWHPGQPRELHTPDGVTITLFMSSQALGWLKIKPVTDPEEIASHLRQRKAMADPLQQTGKLVALDPGAVRTVGMGPSKPLKGVALLRRRHCTDGHPSLAITVKNLRLEGAFQDGRVTLSDVELFKTQGCGTCEAAKMRRRAFTLKVEPEDPTPPRLGALWTFDVLELRVPSFHTGATYLYVAVEKVSKLAKGNHMLGYAESDVSSALNDLRARVRPDHGEIYIIRMDSHPSHRSKHVHDYILDAQMRRQLSPGYVHEGVGDVENLFLHQVPSANSLIVAAPDLNENHFAQALMYVIEAKAHCVTANSSPPKSPAMVYHRSEKFIPSKLQVFGSEAKALVHGEARSSKFELHAQPCIYMGPPVNSDSNAHCAVAVKKEYIDVDLGCIAVNEAIVLDRTRRDHPCTQPYNQVAGSKTVDIGKPTSILDLAGTKCSKDELPSVQAIIWVRSMQSPSSWFTVLLWHGVQRPGDLGSWIHELSGQRVTPLPIDLVLGGQEHNMCRGVVKSALLKLVESPSCLGVQMAPRCKYFSAARFNQPGPPILFDADHVDGIPDEDGELNAEVMIALSDVAFVAKLFRLSAGTDKVMLLEFPASQGAGSPYACKGREKHSTVADTSIMQSLISDLHLEMIFTEQGACGAESRKPTTLLVTPNVAHNLRRTVGTLVVSSEKASTLPSAIGLNDDGEFRTKPTEVYTAEFAMNVAIAMLSSMKALMEALPEDNHQAASPATDDLYPAGTRVDMWWFVDKVWYRGTVTDTRVRKGLVHGKSIPRREIRVRYDSDDQHLWHAVCDYTVREVTNEENEPEQAVLSLLLSRIPQHDASPADAGWLNLLDDSHIDGLTPAQLATRIAGFKISQQRACTSFSRDTDEAMACNAEPVIAKLKNRLVSLSGDSADAMIDDAYWRERNRYSPWQWARMVAERDEWLARSSGKPMPSGPLAEHVGEVFTMRDIKLEIGSGEAIDTARVLAVLDDQSVVDVDYSGAHGWHVPRNEREYNLSPQRDLWRTAKELKMDNYKAVNMFELVPESSVDTKKYKIYDTLWAYKIKFKEGGLIFDKLNPRWCLKGGSMDRDLYKSYAEMMRDTSMGIMWGLKSNYYDQLAAGLLDQSDAFQATSTVNDKGELKEGQSELYCRQAAGFVEKGPNGENMVCRLKCFMQGRIDATAGFDREFSGLLDTAAFKPMLWDPKVRVYHNTELAGTTASLDEIVAKGTEIVAKGLDSPPQQPPRGWAMLGQHVDDSQLLATGNTDPEQNRIIAYVKGIIATVYACKLSGWHGSKMLGFDLTLNDELRTVYVTAQGTFEAMRSKLVTKECVTITPKHIVTESVYAASPGAVPALGDPEREPFLARQSVIRTALGAGIWLSRAYPQMASGINAMCVDMANPSDHRLGQLRHMMMFLGEKPTGKTFGGPLVSSIMHVEDEIKPFTAGAKAGYYHLFSDASINVTGGVGMFAGAAIQITCLRQHLQSPEAHTSELVAAGSNLNSLVAVNGFLQELSVRLGKPTITYFDSKSTVFVASSDKAAKKSIWLTRRNKVVTEAVQLGESRPVHIPEVDMVADSCTKYIVHRKWSRHMHYVLNLPGDPPDCYAVDSAPVKTDAKQ